MNAPDTAALAAANQPEAAKAIQIAEQAFEVATAYVIDSPEMYQAAGDELREISTKAKKVEETRLSLTRPLDEAKRRIMDLFRGPLDRLAEAEKVLRASMLTWKRAEDERIARERAEAERIARQEREAAERAAREAAEAAERARREAAELAAAGDDDAAELAAAAAEDAAAEAAAAAEAVELAEIAPPVAIVAEAPKAAGIATRQTWKAEVIDFAALVKAAAERPELLPYLEANMQTINGVAKSLKAECRIPGVRVYAEEGLAVRRK